MRIDGLSLDFFRNYVHLDAAFDPNINVIYGDNAQGKTNLLEAVAYLSGVSHRARYDRELIQFGVDHAFLKGHVFARERDFLLEAELHRGARRVLRSNGVKLKNGGELSGIFQSVLFCPEDLYLIREGAAARRGFLDDCICQLRPRYAEALAEYQLLMLDAPVSGGAVKAAAGDMTVMASGSDAAFARLAPVLDAVAGKVYRIGSDIGLGSTVKIIHQLLAGVHIAVAAEAMALAARAGIPLETMYDVVTHAAGNSWMFENRMQHVLDGDYSPKSAVDIFVKDLGLVNDTARALTFPLPLATTALNMFTSASNAGFGREDDSAVIKIFNGITLPGHKQ